MASPTIEERLDAAETAVEAGLSLAGTGFWRAVTEVKRRPELVERYADRIAHIDDRAHRNWALLVMPLWLGTSIAALAALGGVALVWWSYSATGWAAPIGFLVGVGAVIGSTHGLAHLVVGRLVGIRFLCWFVGEVKRPQPGVKVEYGSYLRTPPRSRAWMHASGAIATKAVPFLFAGAALAADLPGWVAWLLGAAGVAAVATDVLWSTKASDWKRFQREMEFAQDP
ncbi:MAG TPA: hypothetical protein VK969_09760 [Acidimicrobiia bacterium]|nr:hypothetical protein [Acidimicrobiia bacterium]